MGGDFIELRVFPQIPIEQHHPKMISPIALGEAMNVSFKDGKEYIQDKTVEQRLSKAGDRERCR